MRKLVPLHKQSKKQRKEYNAKQRGSWNGISPVTRIVPNGKAYDRKKARRQSIAHVLTLIENLDTQARVARSM